MAAYAFKRVPAGDDGMHRSQRRPLSIDRADPAIRLLDYQQAAPFWLSYPDPRTRRILFIENSGYPLDSLEAIADSENPLHKVTEFISLNCNWYPETSHHGYAEMRMLDLGLQQSRLQRETTHMIRSPAPHLPGAQQLLDHVPAASTSSPMRAPGSHRGRNTASPSSALSSSSSRTTSTPPICRRNTIAWREPPLDGILLLPGAFTTPAERRTSSPPALPAQR